MTELNIEKPRLVESGQGFCFLNIEYKNKFLYSKYDPFKSIRSLIENLQLLKGTVIVICCPGLLYGIEELKAKAGNESLIIAVEADENLAEITRSCDALKKNPDIPVFSWKNLSEIDSYVREKCSGGKYRRCIRVDFCAGSVFEKEKYEFLINGITEIINVFWKNRITLVKMGRLFSRNIFRNLSLKAFSPELNDVKKTVEKNILVCGAGESLDTFQFWDEAGKGAFYIIAVDAALKPLSDRGIVCNAAVALEAQSVIEKAYVGVSGKDSTVLFADLASRNEVVSSFNKRVFFLSEYAQSGFLDSLEHSGIVSEKYIPLGSVGLAAVNIALNLRKNESIKIFVTGLDFSFSKGATHSKNTAAHVERLFTSGRIKTVENYDAVFSSGSIFTADKNQREICTTKILLSYRDQFINAFRNNVNLYDAGKSGLSLGIPYADDNMIRKSIEENKCMADKIIDVFSSESYRNDAADFLKNELNALESAASLLSEGESSSFRNKSVSLEQQLSDLLKHRDYLFLHFPDGFELRMESDFLKRVKAEILYFIKQCRISIQNLA